MQTMTDKKTRQYEVRLDVSDKAMAEQIEALRGIGAVSLIFTVEETTRAKAIKETLAVLNEFDATYHGAWPSDAKAAHVSENMKLVRNNG